MVVLESKKNKLLMNVLKTMPLSVFFCSSSNSERMKSKHGAV